MAKAIKSKHDTTVFGFNRSDGVLKKALADGAIDEIASKDDIEKLDILFIALYPRDTVEFVKNHIELFHKGCIIVDLCGIKTYVCENLDDLCKNHGLHFIGGHPMAGREFSGYDYSLPTLFEGGSMLLVPGDSSDADSIATIKEFLLPLGFARILETTAEKHDKMIAFTSQLAHVVSSSYIKSPEATEHQGFSAGSYKDLTRVARLNETMWTELFLENAAPLISEIDHIIEHLTEYRNAIAESDADLLKQLLKEGRLRKESIDQNDEL